MTGVLLLVGGSLHEAWRIPLGAIGGTAAFALAIALTGEVSPEEMHTLLARAPLAGRLRRPSRDSR